MVVGSEGGGAQSQGWKEGGPVAEVIRGRNLDPGFEIWRDLRPRFRKGGTFGLDSKKNETFKAN